MGSDGDGLDWEGEVRERSGCLDSGPECSVNTEGGHGVCFVENKSVRPKNIGESIEMDSESDLEWKILSRAGG